MQKGYINVARRAEEILAFGCFVIALHGKTIELYEHWSKDFSKINCAAK